jgi:uncharacterized alpha-E superfamily protein
VLSRLAESYFWMGRYIERAEGTTRLLVEFHQLLVQERGMQRHSSSHAFLRGIGVDVDAPDLSGLVTVVYGTNDAPTSIVGSLDAARRNARSIRDSLPADFFEALNKVHMKCQSAPDPHFPGALLREVLEGLAGVRGVFDWVAPRDEALAFFTLGSYLERLDLVARMLDMRLDDGWPEQGPATMLRAVGGLGFYLRRHMRMTAAHVRLFLATDPMFPRSLLHSALGAESALRDIAAETSTRPEKVTQSVGLLASQLAYADVDLADDLVSDLVRQAMRAVESTSSAVRDQFFRPVGSIVWSH